MAFELEEPVTKLRKIDDGEVEQGVIDMTSNLYELFLSQDVDDGHFDVTFIIDNRELRAHKAVLVSNSTTFKTMFAHRWSNGDNAPIQIQSYSYDNFKGFVSFLYTGKYTITRYNVVSMIDLAEYYGIPALKEECDKVFAVDALTLGEAIEHYEAAKKYSLEFSKSYMLEQITNIRESLLNDPIHSKECVKELVEFETCDQAFKQAFRWAHSKCQYKFKPENLDEAVKKEMAEIIAIMKLDLFTSPFFKSFLVPRQFLFNAADWATIERASKLPLIVIARFDEPHMKLKGRVYAGPNIIERLKDIKFGTIMVNNDGSYQWNGRCKIPSEPSQITNEGMSPYYFIISKKSGKFALKPRESLDKGDYLLAEMFGHWDRDTQKESIVASII